jgi:NAD-dependent DNA ligase
MKNIKKILNTNVLITQINSSSFFILETKLKKKSQKNVHSFSLSQYAFKNSVCFNNFKTLQFKFPLQLTFFSDKAAFDIKNLNSSSIILLKMKHFVLIDKNIGLFNLKNEKHCINKLAFCLQSTSLATNSLLAMN